MDLEIVQTKDGSKTVYSKKFDATYHSRHGALAESRHIFIEHGLKYTHLQGKDTIRVLEIGFGTGLNAMLSSEYARKNNIVVNYTGIEKHEFPVELLKELDYHSFFEPDQHQSINKILSVQNHELSMINPNFQLLKNISDLRDIKWNSNYDVIYFDAFSPKHVPHMWTKDVFEQMYGLLNRNGVLVTFCAQGQFKRDLRTAGFRVERLPGAPGKREMTRGVRD